MMLDLIFGKSIRILISKLIIIILKLKGVKVGKNVLIKFAPELKINGKYSNIIIEDNVKILGKVDIRNRENGKIIFKNNSTFEANCRIVSPNNSIIQIGSNTIICQGTVINGGGDVLIGNNCIIGPFNVINANDHKIGHDNKIIKKEFIYGNIKMEDDCWTGSYVGIKLNVSLKKGSIIGSHSLVTKNTHQNSINYGIPSKFIKIRN